MKRVFVIFLIVVTVAAIAAVCTACGGGPATPVSSNGGNTGTGQSSGDHQNTSGDHQHTWSEWTDMVPEFIAMRGPEERDAVQQHMDNEHLRYCSCGAIEYQAHVPGEAQIASFDPNCGVIPCTVCGHLTDMVQLTFASEWSYDDEMHWFACLTPGYETLKRMYEPHNFVSEQIVTQPTPDTPGQIDHMCSFGHTVSTATPCLTAEMCESYMTFALNDDGASYALTGVAREFPYTTLLVPASHEGKPVTAIRSGTPDSAIYNAFEVGIRAVVLPESVTVIGDHAFDGCRFTLLKKL